MDLNQRLSNLSPQQRNRFLQKLQQQNIDILQLPITPVKRKKDEGFPLSYAQERLWIIQQMEPGNTAYNIVRITQLQGNLDKIILEKSIQEIIKRHEILRTIFLTDNETPRQIILPQLAIPLETIDLKGLTKEEQDKTIKQVIRRENLYAFDLTAVPLLRTILLQCSEYDYLFVMNSHHIITDGTSVRYFGNEMAQFYKAFSYGTSPGSFLPPLPIQYADYACWQRQWFYSQSPLLEKQEQYWLNVFSGEIPALTLPTDYPRPKMQSFEGTSMVFTLEPEETNALNQLALNRETTLYIVLVTLLNVFLTKISSQEDIIIGTTTTGRRHPQLNHLMGMFINTLALRNHPQGTKTFNHFLQEVKEQTLKALDNQDYPYEKLVEKVLVNRNSNRNPLFNVMLNFYNFENIGTDELETTGLKMKPYTVVTETSKFDIVFSIMLRNHRLICTYEYCTRLFKEKTIHRFIQYFKKIISFITGHPGTRISDVEIIPQTEKNQLLFDFNDTTAAYPCHKTIHDLFAEQVEQTPDKIAVVGPLPLKYRTYMTYISYKDLKEKSNQLTHLLREQGIKPDTTVAIMIERSIKMIIGILGILKAGGAYLPIDPHYPQERKQYMLTDSDAKLLVTTNSLAEDSKIGRWEGRVVSLSNTGNSPPKRGGLKGRGVSNLSIPASSSTLTLSSTCQVSPANLAYIIYTSGSTGRPKGVMVQHASVVNILSTLAEMYPLSKTHRFLLKTSFTFDVSVVELLGWFWGGGQLVILPKDLHKDPQRILTTIEYEKITHINFVPSMFGVFIDQLEQMNMVKLSSLSYIFLAGEALPPYQVKKFRDLNTSIALENLYGPTEGAIYASGYSLSQWEGNGNIPIGKPLQNVKLYILDSNRCLVPIGITGELFIAGHGIARGYLNNPELTAEKFDHDFWDFQDYHDEEKKDFDKKLLQRVQGGGFLEKSPPGRRRQKLYRTGDLARWLPDGNIEFLGRVDQQIKLRGFRIELGEIETQLKNHPVIKEAVVITTTKNHPGKKQLCAYIVGEQVPDITGLREFLAKKLPNYMIPAYFITLDHIPLSPNGKIDRNALPHPEILPGKKYIAPRNKLEEKLTKIWSGLLGVKEHTSIGIDDNFFELGGHSLNATILTVKIYKTFNTRISLAQVFDTPTIRQLSDFIHHTDKTRFISIAPIEKKEYYPISSAQKQFYVMQQINPRATTYNLPIILEIKGELEQEKLEKVFHELIQRHETLRTSFSIINQKTVQQIHDKVEFALEYYDTSEVEVKIEEKEATRGLASLSIEPAAPSTHSTTALINSFIRPFDLSRAPLLQVGLLKLPKSLTNSKPTNHIFIMNLHHILNDFLSQEILIREFFNLYMEKTLPALKLQYKDYSHWQNQLVLLGEIKKQEKYWLNLFKDGYPELNIPTDFPRSRVQSFAGSFISFDIDREKTGKLIALAREENATLFMVYLAVACIFLHKLSGQVDITVGTVVAGRRHPELEHIIGPFVNTLVLRNSLAPNKTFRQLLEQVRKQTLDAFDNQDYRFEDLVQKVMPERDTSRNPLFDVMFSFASQEMDKNKVSQQNQFLETIGIKVEPFENPANSAKFDLTLSGANVGLQCGFSMGYCTALFKTQSIQRYISYIQEIVSLVAENPDIPLNHITLATDLEAVISDVYHQSSEFQF